MTAKRMLEGVARALLLGSLAQPTAVWAAGGEGLGGCRFDQLQLNVGVSRGEVESEVGDLLGEPSRYSPYGNNLAGGTVRYRDGDCALDLVYKPGAPAPWVRAPDGSTQHYPPVDETLIEYRIERIADRPEAGEGR